MITITEQFGLTGIILPFILIFVIIYAVLFRLKWFKKGPNIVIALVMALTTVSAHVLGRYPPCWDVVIIINNALPKISMLILSIISFLLIIGLFFKNLNFASKFMNIIIIFVVIYVVYTFLTSGGSSCYNLNISIFPWLKYVIGILVGVLIIWFITGKSKSDDDDDDIY
jgi:hypothetical protein